jgi:hypothetical protein
MALAAPAHAEIAATWFNLDPPPAATEGDTPLDTVFYSRTARYQGLARLSEPYQLTPGDPKGGEIPAGAPLYLVRGHKAAYLCSLVVPRDPNAGEIAGLTLKTALGFNLFGGTAMPRAWSSQCFRDSDNDGRFDEVAIGNESFGTIAHNRRLNDPEPLANPIKYEALDPAASAPPITFTVTLSAQSLGGDRYFRARTCLQITATDYSTPDTFCLPGQSSNIDAHKLPDTVDFLDGQITISAIAPDGAGGIRAHYVLSKPPTARSIMLLSRRVLAPFDYDVFFTANPPAANGAAPAAQ